MRYLFVFSLLVLLSLACGSNQATAPRAPYVTSRKITYEIVGTSFAEASLTLTNKSGGTEQKVIKIPWKTDFEASPGQFVYLSGQLKGNGKITCRILVDGKVFKEAKSEGQYVISSCDGSVP